MEYELYHHGIKGQRWGIRRFQNEDGSLTADGMRRYSVDNNGKMSKKGMAEYYRDNYKYAKSQGLRGQDLHNAVKSRYANEDEYNEAVKNYRKWKGGKATAIALGSVGALAAHAAVAGTIIGTHNVKKKNAQKYADTLFNRQTQAIISEGQSLTDRLVKLQDNEKGLMKAKHDAKSGVLDTNKLDRMFKIGEGNNQQTLGGWNMNQYNPSRWGTKNERNYNIKDAIGQHLSSNRTEQENIQQRLEVTKDNLKNLLSVETERKKEMTDWAYKNYRKAKNFNKVFAHSEWIVGSDDYLMHYGIKGQKWGIRRYQNEDGTLTPEGMKRYGIDRNGNMSKRGAAEYYRDIYNNAKSSGYRGQALHDVVRSKFNSDEEYEAYAKNYKSHKAKKAMVGIGAGLAGAALTGAGIYGISRGVHAAKVNNLVNQHGSKFANATPEQLINIANDRSKASRTFNVEGDRDFTNKVRRQLKTDSIVAEAMAKRRMKDTTKEFKSLAKTTADKGGNVLDTAKSLYEKASTSSNATKLDKFRNRELNKRGDIAAKYAAKQMKRERVANLKIAALDQVKTQSGKDATANAVNAFANSFVSKLTTGTGTMAAGMALGAVASGGKSIVSKLIDDQTANYMFQNPGKDKDKSSALTQPVTVDQAWRDRKKKKENDED